LYLIFAFISAIMSEPVKRPTLGRGAAIMQRLKEKKEREAAVGLASGMAKLSVTEAPHDAGASALPAPSPVAVTVASTVPIPKLLKPVEIEPRVPVVRMGKAGQPIDVAANYVNIRQINGRSLYEYTVTMEPPVDEIK
jgi:hypothetical protein